MPAGQGWPKTNFRSKKRSREDTIYAQRRVWFLGMPENSRCPVAEAGLIPDLNGQILPHWRAATTIHHAWKRGKYYLDESTWIGASFEGHVWIENHKEEARKRGWLCDTTDTKERWVRAQSRFRGSEKNFQKRFDSFTQ